MREDGAISLGKLTFRLVLGTWLICERPSANSTLYFGDDSVALLNRLRARSGEHVLDLCCGPGIQSIWCASHSKPARVVASDINPLATSLVKLNAELNNVGGLIEAVCGDLYEAVDGAMFDLICMNPPLIPLAEDMSYGLVGNGGPDGLNLVKRALAGLPVHLNNGGRFQTLGLTVSDGILPIHTEEIGQWSERSGIGVRLVVLHHVPAKPGFRLFHAIALTSAMCSREWKAEGNECLVRSTELKLSKLASKLNFSHFCDYFLFASRNLSGFELMDLSTLGDEGLWFF